MIYYVFYAGVGSDGGFGDYAPPMFGSEPVKVEGQVMWVRTKDEAERLKDRLNDLASEAFYGHGVHSQYDGNFPMEYEYRAMFVPDSQPVGVEEAAYLMTVENHESWKTVSTYGEWPEDEDDDIIDADEPDEAPNLKAIAAQPRQYERPKRPELPA